MNDLTLIQKIPENFEIFINKKFQIKLSYFSLV